MPETTCISCHHQYESKFCPECGERAFVKKITLQSIIEDGVATVTSMNKGFPYNIKRLILDPKDFVESYLRGRRKGVFNPISFIIISITVYLVVNSMLYTDIQKTQSNNEYHNLGFETAKLLRNNLKYFWIPSIFLLALATKVVFRKLSFVEHLTICAFVLGQATLAGVLEAFFVKSAVMMKPSVYIVTWITVFRIFREDGKTLISLLKSLGTLVLFFLQLAILFAAIVLVLRFT